MSIWKENLLIEENIRFSDPKRLWIGSFNWEKYLIGNSEMCSEPSFTSRMQAFPKLFNGEKLFLGVH